MDMESKNEWDLFTVVDCLKTKLKSFSDFVIEMKN